MTDMDQGMDMDMGDEVFELIDDEGNSELFSLLDVIETETDTYLALELVDEEAPEDEPGEVVFMLVTRDENGEDCYEPVTDDDLNEKLFSLFEERLEQEETGDEEDGE